MELPFEVLNQSQLDAERSKLNKNMQENIDYSETSPIYFILDRF